MKNVLIVAAHPDDEVLGCGGTIARHVAKGDKVSVLWMTDGVGSRFYGSERIGNNDAWLKAQDDRLNAAAAAMRVLGAEDFGRRFDRSSGTTYALEDQRIDLAGVTACAKAIEDAGVDPQVVYTHWKGDLNLDHAITARAVLTAFRPIPDSSVEAIYGFEVPSSTEWGIEPFVPDFFVPMDHETFERKLRAIQAYDAEMRPVPHARSYGAVTALATMRGNTVSFEQAEAFHTYRKVWRP